VEGLSALQFNLKAIPGKFVFLGAYVAACGIFFFINWRLAFHVSYNDFWGILF
jgi:hypothetical protein